MGGLRLSEKRIRKGRVTLVYTRPLPVQPGTYNLRLVISERQDASWQSPDASTFHFDTANFVVDKKPQGGSCTVVPSAGTQMTTEFAISSADWIEEDLPLQYEY